MVKIKVLTRKGVYVVTEVTEDTYKIIRRKVIEGRCKHEGLRVYFNEEPTQIVERLMQNDITEKMVNDSITECINNIKNKTR